MIFLFLPYPVWLSWLEHCAVSQKFVGLIPSLGTYLGCGFGPQSGCMRGNQSMFLSHINLSVSLSLSSPLSQINKHVLGWGLKKIKIKLYFYFWEKLYFYFYISIYHGKIADLSFISSSKHLLSFYPLRTYTLKAEGKKL